MSYGRVKRSNSFKHQNMTKQHKPNEDMSMADYLKFSMIQRDIDRQEREEENREERERWVEEDRRRDDENCMFQQMCYVKLDCVL